MHITCYKTENILQDLDDYEISVTTKEMFIEIFFNENCDVLSLTQGGRMFRSFGS